jgi:hypothetical protein
MSTKITYAGQDYYDVEHDVEDTLATLLEAFNTDSGTGILAVATKHGKVHLLVSRSIPIAVSEYKGSPSRSAVVL